MDNTDAILEQGIGTVKFCISLAQDVWRRKINDGEITNNELKVGEEDRSLLTFWKKA
jgi:hypothetical protein